MLWSTVNVTAQRLCSCLQPCSLLKHRVWYRLRMCCFAQGLSSSGSGLILDPDGTILTSAQIVSAAAETRRGVNGRMQQPKVLITLQDRRVYQGRVISSDRYSTDSLLEFCMGTFHLRLVQLSANSASWGVQLDSKLMQEAEVIGGPCAGRRTWL